MKLLRERLKLLESLPEEFITRAQSAERKAIREILSLLAELDIEDGRILNTRKNLLKADKIFAEAEKVFKEPYQKAVGKFLQGVDKVAALNLQYMEGLGVDKAFNYIITAGKENAVRLLGEGGVIELNSIRSVLDIAISSGTTIPELTRQLKNVGFVSRHAKTHAVDAMMIIDRTYTKKLADEFDFEWYLYLGGLIKDSRCFCVARATNYYHKLEVESWGKPSNADLWTNCAATFIEFWSEQDVVYHGSKKIIQSFDLEKVTKWNKFGHFFTGKIEFANQFGDMVTEAVLSLKNPKVISQQEWWDIRGDHAGDDRWFSNWKKELSEQGFDGLRVRSSIDKVGNFTVENPEIFVAFSDNQVTTKREAQIEWRKDINAGGHPGGRNPLTTPTTIFTLAGGFNCRHIIAPVSETSVPKKVRDRIG